jgi:hypothetical protein
MSELRTSDPISNIPWLTCCRSDILYNIRPFPMHFTSTLHFTLAKQLIMYWVKCTVWGMSLISGKAQAVFVVSLASWFNIYRIRCIVSPLDRHIFCHMYVVNVLAKDILYHISGADPGGAPGACPPKIGKKNGFFCVKSWFFTRNTPKMFAPHSAIGKNTIFWRIIVIFHTKFPH